MTISFTVEFRQVNRKGAKMKLLILTLCIAVAAANPLTSDEAKLVKDSWHHVMNNEVDILYAVFKAYPDIQAKFTMFAGKDLEDLKGTPEFALHATRIVSFISEVVNLMGNDANTAALKSMTNEMAIKHKARGVTKAQFGEFKTALMSYMKAHTAWGDNVEHSWSQGIDNFYEVIFAVLDS